MKGQKIIEYIVNNKLYDTEFDFNESKTANESMTPVKEPNSLTEISEVTYEYGRVVLTIKPGYMSASRKFKLFDNCWKYEFDGGTMYFYRKNEEACSWSYSCGKGAYTLVSNRGQNCIAAVKQEMATQIVLQNLPVPKGILWDLPLNTNYIRNRKEV